MKMFWTCCILAPTLARGVVGAEFKLPHHEEIAPGVHALGFPDKFRSANCGIVDMGDSTLLVDLPRGIDVAEFLSEAERVTGNAAGALVLTHAAADDAPLVEELRRRGITKVYLSPATYKTLTAATMPSSDFQSIAERGAIGDPNAQIEFVPLDDVFSSGGGAVTLKRAKVIFGGPLVVHGPRAVLPGSDTIQWTAALRQLAELRPSRVVPGFGSWGNGELLDRHLRFLSELRRQVAYHVAQGRPPENLSKEVRLPADYFVWMPYDTPLVEHLGHVYRELTVPRAPFEGQPPADDTRSHALVLVGDLPHEPGHIEHGLQPAFDATGVVPHFTVDVRALSAENLARVKLLVILRDGLQRPAEPGTADYEWMTPTQQQEIVDFVERGGGFLNLHNSMGLYPKDGPYLKLVGGRYEGHGPLERFRVEVVDREHPITRGVEDFSVADEQHTPYYDAERVHLLLRNRSDDGQTAAAGWVREQGKGRVCHLANGHTRESLAHPMYQRLMQNAMLWCLRQDR